MVLVLLLWSWSLRIWSCLHHWSFMPLNEEKINAIVSAVCSRIWIQRQLNPPCNRRIRPRHSVWRHCAGNCGTASEFGTVCSGDGVNAVSLSHSLHCWCAPTTTTNTTPYALSVKLVLFISGSSSDVNKDWTCKDKDKDKDQAYKDQDKDKD